MLEGVLEPGGTASAVSVPGYVLAGKTGTAQKVENGTYSDTKYVASFVGFAPAQQPKLLVAVVVDEPQYVHTGGAVAAPVFGEIAEFALPYLGISPDWHRAGDRRLLHSPAMELDELRARLRRGRGAPRRRRAVEIRRSRLRQPRGSAPGTLFFCFRGEKSDGHEFAPAAVEDGAAALVVERPLDLDVPQVAGAGRARGDGADRGRLQRRSDRRARRSSGSPARTARRPPPSWSATLLEAAGRRCGLLGTVQQVVGGQVEEVERTTPEAIDLQRTFARMLEAGDESCAMEVSSHALVLHRADAIHFAVKVFTNLTQDHLDFHADMEDYFEAKRLLFSAEGGAPIIELEGGRLGDQRRRSVRPAAGRGARLRLGRECVTYSAAGGRRRSERPRTSPSTPPARASPA